MAAFVRRVVRAAALDASLYEEVEADESATGQALAVVVLSSVAAGVGSAFQADYPVARGVYGLLAALFGWILWAGLTYVFGAKLFPAPQTRSNIWELLRTIGFASAPGLIRVFACLPVFGVVVSAVASVWMLIAMVIAVRQALDYPGTMRAVGVCLLGWVAQLALQFVPFVLVPAMFREAWR
jgi:hypothetical protein